MNIIDAIEDPKLMQDFLGPLGSWNAWLTALKAMYGLPIASRDAKLISACTGRSAAKLPSEGFRTNLFLTGRRSGKSRIAAVIGSFEAALAGHESKLAKGERGIIAICAPSRAQSTICKNYLRAIFNQPSLLAGTILQEDREGFTLKNGNRIQIATGDWRTIRGYTLIAAIIDEACFFGYDTESKVLSDTELIRAIQPGLSSTEGKLICISSPYATKGYCYSQFRKNYGNESSPNLIWNCPSRTMNPTLKQAIIDEAIAEDPAAARSEYLGEFRDDIAEFMASRFIEELIIEGRKELSYNADNRYYAFADLSGGRSDDAALAIAHKQGDLVVLDLLKRYRPPFNPYTVIGNMAAILRRYRLKGAMGDNYAADFTRQAFNDHAMRYKRCKESKSILYAELLPHISSKQIELLDLPDLVKQLASLERRTRSGGRDLIDHPPGGHDDLANVLAGVIHYASSRRSRTTKAL